MMKEKIYKLYKRHSNEVYLITCDNRLLTRIVIKENNYHSKLLENLGFATLNSEYDDHWKKWYPTFISNITELELEKLKSNDQEIKRLYLQFILNRKKTL